MCSFQGMPNRRIIRGNSFVKRIVFQPRGFLSFENFVRVEEIFGGSMTVMRKENVDYNLLDSLMMDKHLKFYEFNLVFFGKRLC